MTVRTRFAPSPTGYLHVGGARTALFSWLYARKHGGKFILRIEDTDLERSTPESVNAILEGMTWLGLEYDEGPFYQTHHFDRYNEVIQQFVDEGKAYRCSCSKERLETLREEQMANKQKPRYDGHCRGQHVDVDAPHVIRFMNPQEGTVVFDDMVRGKVAFQNSELDDLIIRRTDGSPTYNLTVVVDDLDMAISHVIRGDDHLNNTPRQINIIKALGKEPPRYSHVPMILGDDGARLSKRHGAVSVMQYHEEGYLPEALLNYLVRLGWSHGDQEIFSLDEMIELFDIENVNKAASAFNTEKLLWLNQHYIKNDTPARVARLLSPHMGELGIDPAKWPPLEEVVAMQAERANTLLELARICAIFYQDTIEHNENGVKKNFKAAATEPLNKVKDRLVGLEDWSRENIHAIIHGVADELEVKLGKVGMPLRFAITGGVASGDLELTVYLTGKQASLQRIDKALDYIQQRAAV